MYELPTSITVDDTEYSIRNKGDFRMVLDCFSALNDEELEEDMKVATCLIIFYENFDNLADLSHNKDIEQLVKQMFAFFNCNRENAGGVSTKHKLIDWEQDEQLIISAVNNVAGKELRSETYVHWWTFMGYYTAVGESPLASIVSIRDKVALGKKLEKQELEFKKNNPEYFIWKADLEKKKADDEWIKGIWGS